MLEVDYNINIFLKDDKIYKEIHPSRSELLELE